MIFGILGKFRIGIGDRKNFGRKLFRRKKIENFLLENVLGPKNFDVLVDKIFIEKLMKIQNFEILKFWGEIENFQNFEFSLIFQ